MLKSLYTQSVDSDRQIVEAVAQVAEQRGVPRAQIALAWVASRSPCPRPSWGRPSRTTSRTRWLRSDIRLTDEEVASLEAPYVPHPIEGFA